MYIYYIGLVIFIHAHHTRLLVQLDQFFLFFPYNNIIVHYTNLTAFDPGEYNSI